MTEAEKIAEWVRYYGACNLKLAALRAVLKNDGEAMLGRVLDKLRLRTATDVIKACKAAHEE